MQEIQNGTFTTFFSVVFCLITKAFQYLEHPWVVKVLLLVVLRNIVSAFSKVNKLFRNMTQALWQRGHGWQGLWDNMGRYLENFLTSSGLELHSQTSA